VVQSCRNQDGTMTFVIPNQPHEISSPESMTNQGRDIIKSIQSH
jgi:hypothetical protein